MGFMWLRFFSGPIAMQYFTWSQSMLLLAGAVVVIALRVWAANGATLDSMELTCLSTQHGMSSMHVVASASEWVINADSNANNRSRSKSKKNSRRTAGRRKR